MKQLRAIVGGSLISSLVFLQLASAHGDLFKGVIIESGLMDIKGLPMVMQMSFMLPGGPDLLKNLPDPLGTLAKLKDVKLPLLVIHGDKDEIVPVTQGQACHSDSASEDKTLKIFAGGTVIIA